MNKVHIDGVVLLFTLAISLVAALLSGVFPAWVFGKADPQEAMKAGARGTTRMLLVGLGIYGVVSYSVTQRTTEMGIRMALGAQVSHIRGLVLRQGLAPVLIGLAAGIVASLGVDRLLSSLLFGISPADPLTVAGVIVLIAGIAAFAAYLPARRTTRIDPATALRYE